MKEEDSPFEVISNRLNEICVEYI